MSILNTTSEQLQKLEAELSQEYAALKGRGLNLNLTRGKPSAAQLDLANQLDGILQGDYRADDGTDTRNYSDVKGIAEARRLGAELLEVPADNVYAAGNASLSLMFFAVMLEHQFGSAGPESAWNKLSAPKFLCPVPGYDRHFGICETLGIEMVTVPMTDTGPDMDVVEQMVVNDPEIVGIWCVPKYSNPTGCTYSDETVRRIAELGAKAGPQFRVFWDNAYAVHHLGDDSDQLASLWQAADTAGTLDHVWLFGSSSKITFAGAGVSWVAASDRNLSAFGKLVGMSIIGFDKVNQLRHARLFPDLDALKAHMVEHTRILKPKFDAVENALSAGLYEGYGSWTSPRGGYFVSFDTQPGIASEVVRLAAEAGVTLTPAGATYPYGKDPHNCNIRLAPTLPPMDELLPALEVFVCCVKLATVRKLLNT